MNYKRAIEIAKMRFYHTPPYAFNPDAVVNHEELSEKVNAEMEYLEEVCPPQSRKERANRRKRVYERLSENYQTYRERDGG